MNTRKRNKNKTFSNTRNIFKGPCNHQWAKPVRLKQFHKFSKIAFHLYFRKTDALTEKQLTKAAVQSWFSFLSTRSHKAASTSPFLFRIIKPKPTDAVFLDSEIATFTLWIESARGSFQVAADLTPTCIFLYCTSINSTLYKSARDQRSLWVGAWLLKTSLFLYFHIIQQAEIPQVWRLQPNGLGKRALQELLHHAEHLTSSSVPESHPCLA